MSKLKKDYSQFFLVTGSSQKDYFDDCPICQALKKAEKEGRSPTMTELREATLEAKQQGAVTGGSLLDKGLN